MVLCACHHMRKSSVADVIVVLAIINEQRGSTMVFPSQRLHVCGDVLSIDVMAVHSEV